MRVVVAADSISGLSPRAASEVIARAFAERGAQVAVVPLGVGGRELAAAASEAAPAAVFSVAQTSEEVGDALAGAAPEAPLVLDLTDCAPTDLGRGALARFGEDPAGALARARRVFADRELVALVRQGQEAQPLTGLEGHASTVRRAAGATLQEILAFDADAERWANELGLTPGPGAGAAGGLGLLVQALGGRVVDPLTWLGERFNITRTLELADLVVTGAELLEFHDVGGPVVRRVVAWAGDALRPVVAIAGRNYVSARELRVAGLESAHALRGGAAEDTTTPDELAAGGARIAASWLWSGVSTNSSVESPGITTEKLEKLP